MAYGIPIDELKAAVEAGYFFMKIKIGQPGTQAEMLEKDKARISAIHAAIGDARTPYTANGKLPYYFDANGRYESKDTLLQLIDHTKAIGAFEQIALIEEPFPEELEIDIRDIPARVAADESAHTDRDALKRIQMGYTAIALKPIAKTFSMSLKIAQVAHELDRRRAHLARPHPGGPGHRRRHAGGRAARHPPRDGDRRRGRHRAQPLGVRRALAAVAASQLTDRSPGWARASARS